MKKTQKLFKTCLYSYLIFSFFFLIFFFDFPQTKQVFAFRTEGSQIMMAGPSHYAIQAGKTIAKEGGNVVDVAVTMILTLSVISPYFSSLGGGGFALVKMESNPVQALDFREKAPKHISSDFFQKDSTKSSLQGGSAVAVPGLPAGLLALHQKHGRLKWRKLFKWPLKWAKRGFQVSGDWARVTKKHSERFNSAGKKYFLPSKPRPSSSPRYSANISSKKSSSAQTFYSPGDLFRQTQLVSALKALRDKKQKGFYSGKVARDIVSTVQKEGGMLTEKDLEEYKVRWRSPLRTKFQGHILHLIPPPSSGGVVLKTAFYLTEKWEKSLKTLPPLHPKELHLLGEILSRAFRGRMLLGDPDFFLAKPSKSPLSKLLSKSYLDFLKSSIDIKKTKKLSLPKSTRSLIPLREKKNTTHISVLDRFGNAVAMTVSVNGAYGSGVATEKYGIFLNNHMDDFNTQPGKPNIYGLIQGKENQILPEKRPLSSMSPTLVEREGKIVLSAGGAGGPRIISGVFQLLYRVLAQGAHLDQAIEALRVHHQFLPHILFVDRKLQPATKKELEKKGHKIKSISHAGWVSATRLNEEGFLEAAYENVREGASGGY